MPWDYQLMLPEGFIALQAELATGFHTKLQERLANHPVEDWEIKLAEIALYCNVVLDAVYSPDELDKLGSILAGRLEAIREVAVPQTILPLIKGS